MSHFFRTSGITVFRMDGLTLRSARRIAREIPRRPPAALSFVEQLRRMS